MAVPMGFFGSDSSESKAIISLANEGRFTWLIILVLARKLRLLARIVYSSSAAPPHGGVS